jgi:hypothetical protein
MNDIQLKIEAVLKQKLTNQALIRMYYEIGSMMVDFDSKQIKKTEQMLKEKYGVVIAFTERNFIHMIHFSQYDLDLLPKLENITWKNHLVILKENNLKLIDICLEYKPTKQELVQYIKNNKELKKHDTIELDDTLEELLNLQKRV